MRQSACGRSAEDLALLLLNAPSETRVFEKGILELDRIGPVTLDRATFDPDVSLHVLGSEDYAAS